VALRLDRGDDLSDPVPQAGWSRDETGFLPRSASDFGARRPSGGQIRGSTPLSRGRNGTPAISLAVGWHVPPRGWRVPLVYSIDHADRVIVVKDFVAVLPDEVSETAGQLLADESVGTDYCLMFLMEPITTDAPSEVVSWVALVLRALRTRFKSRYAIVTQGPGAVVMAYFVAFEADDGSDSIRAFTSEAEARAWLLAGGPSPRAH